MASYKVFVSFAVLVACIFAAHADDALKPEQSAPVVPEQQALAGIPQPLAPEGQNREKKHAIIYDAPLAYSYPAVPAVHTVPVVSSYSYQYHGAYPYAYRAAYYPGYAYPTYIL